MNTSATGPWRRDALFYVEQWGLLFEQSGLPRMAGRVLGWLLLCDPPEQTAAQLLDGLAASKGSISTTTRLLERFGIVERVCMPGDRRTYFRVAPGAFTTMIEDKLRYVTTWKELAGRGLALLKKSPKARARRLQSMHDFYSFLEQEFPALIERWR
ncbi:MAG TPA: MarR family transcriptional regulator, partial [Thermoanaerobaculia bacterium]